jgi:uncharacterized protein (DUF2252 family)
MPATQTPAPPLPDAFRRAWVLGKSPAGRQSVAERMAAGKSLRGKVPRRSHATYEPALGRRDPVAILEEQARTRLPQLVPIRYARMLRSPFAFFRGAAAVMAGDLAPTPATGLVVQACGDAHVSNFGAFASAERNLVFGINDFDETLPGPWEWDVKRLAASAVVCARFLGGDAEDGERAVRKLMKVYRQRMREYAGMGYLQVWYSRIEAQDVLATLPSSLRRRAKRLLARARARTHLQVLDKMTDLVDDEQRILESRPLIVRETVTARGRAVSDVLAHFIRAYLASIPDDRKPLIRRYRVVDVARKVVGVGSVGTRCWVVFLAGNNREDPLFLQVKEAQPSVLAPYTAPSAYANQGERVVVGQRLIQGAPDIFLGWGENDGISYYIRQLRDMKGSAELEPGQATIKGFIEWCGLCGWALALAHAKSGDPAMIAGYVGKGEALDDAIAQFAAAYADQTERDHDALAGAARRHRIKVARER